MINYYNVDGCAPDHFVKRVREQIYRIEQIMGPKSSGYEPAVAEILGCTSINHRYWDMVDESDGLKYELKKGNDMIFDAVRYAELFSALNGAVAHNDALVPTITVLFFTTQKRIKDVFFVSSVRIFQLIELEENTVRYHLERFALIKQTRGLYWNSQVIVSKARVKKVLMV